MTPRANAELRRFELIDVLCAQVDADRLTRHTLQLAKIPSPSGAETDVAEAYATMLSRTGLSVEIDDEFAESPSVIGRYPFGNGNRVLQLDGHLDTISTKHQAPHVSNGFVVGRGACDMKGGLAVIAEVVRILVGAGLPLGGSVLVTAHGQHEEAAPGRVLHAPLLSLLHRGITGDACLIPEGPHRDVPVSGRGLMIFRISFWRPGEPVHELLGEDSGTPNPLIAAHRLISAIEDRSASWQFKDPLAGSESFFIGAVQGGDFYNRVPKEAVVRGTRRYPIGRTYDSVEAEFNEIATRTAAHIGCEVTVELERSGQPFSIRPGELIVRALREAYLHVVGTQLPLAGIAYTGDVSHFVNEAQTPALYHGTDQSTAHSNIESVAIVELLRCAKVFLGTVVSYLGVGA